MPPGSLILTPCSSRCGPVAGSSALGVHGFAHGGFLVEAGKRTEDAIAPLVARVDFPEAWRVVVVVPSAGGVMHGQRERDAFRDLAGRHAPPGTTDMLCRLVLLGMLPALVEHDLAAFGEALFDFNARVGEMFASVQGGTYASPFVAEVVRFVRQVGVEGVGQSSWGPALAAVVGDADRAFDLVHDLQRQFGLSAAEVFATRGQNRGAAVEAAQDGGAAPERA